MTPLEALLSTASPRTLELARDSITEEQLALMIAKCVLSGTSLEVSASQAADVLRKPRTTVGCQLDRIAFKEAAK